MDFPVELSYISASANKTPFSVDWSSKNLIAYGASFSIVICESHPVLHAVQTLISHNSRVNCVAWIRNPAIKEPDELISGSTDKTIVIWKYVNDKFNVENTLKGHTGPVSCVSGLYTYQNGDVSNTFVASCSVDSTVKIWLRSCASKNFECVHNINLGTGFASTVSWCNIPKTSLPMLAYGGDDQKVHVFTWVNNKLNKLEVLIGHEDWVRCLDFIVTDSDDVLLASCAQDHHIRIWKFCFYDSRYLDKKQDDSLIKAKETIHPINVTDCEKLFCSVSIETVLSGHEGWIYSARWKQPLVKDGKRHQPLCILSASMDKTLILWEPDIETGVWIEKVRVGDVGGNTPGFYGGLFDSSGDYILAHGYHGAFQVWRKDKSSWSPEVTMGGHYDAVNDICWQPSQGNYLLSVSSDQTCRLHAAWKRKNKMSDRKTNKKYIYEIGRPQIHGYDLQCLAMLGMFEYASGADEKVIRMFRSARNFTNNLNSICSLDPHVESEQLKSQDNNLSAAEGATVPALGLSNKAIYHEDLSTIDPGKSSFKKLQSDQYQENYFSPLSTDVPPPEPDLLQNTLWPEYQKLYGHGYEIYALASDSTGRTLASACKASKVDHAVILIWDVADTLEQKAELKSHSLTVTKLSFSPDCLKLLSVSRDRTWSLFKRPNSNSYDFTRVSCPDKKSSLHSRIIWDCCWTFDSKYFITVSRDKKAIIWDSESVEREVQSYGHILSLEDSVTAVDVASIKSPDNRYIISFGLESGKALLYIWSDKLPQTAESWLCICTLDQSLAHHLSVKRLQFRSRMGKIEDVDTADNYLQLASCGADHFVKIYSIDLNKLPR